jgi:predicted aminopeptidase
MYSGFAAKFASLELLVLSSRRSLERLFVMPNAPDQKRAKMNAIKKYTAAPVF